MRSPDDNLAERVAEIEKRLRERPRSETLYTEPADPTELLLPKSVNRDLLARNAVGREELDTDAVGTDEIENGSVTDIKLFTPPYVAPDPGTHHGDRFGLPASVPVGASRTWFAVEIPIPDGTPPLTGIRYRAGAVTSGNVRSALYDDAGTRVANRTTDSLVPAAGTRHDVAFDASYDPVPGVHFALLIWETGLGDFVGSGAFIPTATGVEATFVTPTAITPPTGPDSTTAGRPLLSLY